MRRIVTAECFSSIRRFVIGYIHYIYTIFILRISINFCVVPSPLSKGSTFVYMLPAFTAVIRTIYTSFFFVFNNRPNTIRVYRRNCNPNDPKSSFGVSFIFTYFFPSSATVCTFPKGRSFATTTQTIRRSLNAPS